MKYGREYARRPSGGGSGLLLLILLAAALIIGYGESEAAVSTRQTIVAFWESLAYEEALETLGRSFSLESDKKNAIMVFGQEILGFTSE